MGAHFRGRQSRQQAGNSGGAVRGVGAGCLRITKDTAWTSGGGGAGIDVPIWDSIANPDFIMMAGKAGKSAQKGCQAALDWSAFAC
jgi:hypothetical protein